MEYFVWGVMLGYFLFPLSEIFGKIVANAWDKTAEDLRRVKHCVGDCNQGRRDCEAACDRGAK